MVLIHFKFIIYMLCLFLDEYWSNHPELHDIPIYYASSLAKKCMTVYQTYINAMNDKIRRQISISNPFVFKHISNLKVHRIFIFVFIHVFFFYPIRSEFYQFLTFFCEAVVVVVIVIVWYLNLQLSMQSVPITTKIVPFNLVQARCTRYNIM